MRFTLLAALALAALPCVAAAEPKAPLDPSLAASDAALLQDEAKATDELKRRLRGQVSYRDGILVIIDRGGTAAGTTVMPAGIMWGIDCGDNGIAVTFGAGSADTDNGIVLQLTSASVSDAKCANIAPALGAALLAITKGN